MEHKYDVFISYSRKDTRTVDKICEAFDANGITYFIDRAGIGGGSEFPAVLANAIKSSKLFLFIGSKNSYDSKFTQSEVVFAFNKKEKGEIIPYIIDGSNLPDGLDFTFSAINRRNIKDHPIETVLINDINSKLDRVQKSFNADYIKCTHCNRQHSATAMFCEYTGKRLVEVVEHKQEKAERKQREEARLAEQKRKQEEACPMDEPYSDKVEDADNSKDNIQNDDTQNTQLEVGENNIDDNVSLNHDYIDLIEDIDNDYSTEQLYEKGYNYYYGKGVERDATMAVNYLLSAAKMNHAKAQSFLYKCYYLGIGVDKDKNKALYWIKRSAENNDTESQLEYAKELIKLEKYDEAACWLETIVNNYYLSQSDSSSKEFGTNNYLNDGLPEQQHEISIVDDKIIFDGKEVFRDNSSEEWIQYITKLNPIRDDFKEMVANAMLLLGEFYEKGLGKDIDITQAKRWYNDAEKYGNSEARNRLAIIVDQAKAKLIAQEVKEAPSIIPYEEKFELAGRYITGRGINKNPETAVCLLKECSSHGMEKAAYELGRCYLTGIGIKRNDEMAYRLFEFAAKKGIFEALFLQGVMAEWGRGTMKDRAMALRLYSKSALNYHVPAIKHLSHCYQDGVLLKKDKTKASLLYDFARMIHEKDNKFFWDTKTKDDFLKLFNIKKEQFETIIADIKEEGGTVYNNNDSLLPYEEIHGLDLGLTSGKIWADYNVGATEENLLGLQFAWAETETKERFEWGNYFDYSPKSSGGFKNYKNVGTSFVYSSKVDPSCCYYGNNWRTPSLKEMEELINECSWQWLEGEDFIGYELTGCTGRKMRIPLTNLTKCVGVYWCRTLDKNKSSKYAKCLYFDKKTIGIKSAQRYLGLNVRPIMVKSIFNNVSILPFSSHHSSIFDDDLIDNM